MYAYRIPLLDELHNRLGAKFTVITHKTQTTANNQKSLTSGQFPRLLLGGRHIELNRRLFDGRGTPLGLTFTPGLLFALLRIRPRIVIAVTFNTWTLASLLLGIPTIIFWEGTHYTERSTERWRRRLRRWMACRAKGFIVNGKLAKAYLVEQLGANPADVFEGGQSPLPPPIQLPKPADRTDATRVRFLFVGQLIPRKGCAHLIEAAARLKQKGAGAFELRILGDGPELEGLRELADRHGLLKQTKFLGAVAPDAVWNEYAMADVFALPTLTDNWPLAVIEAMFMAKPVLLSKFAGSVPDLIEEGANGFSFDPHDHAKLAALMGFYVDDHNAIKAHGERSLALAQAYRPERVADVYMAALRHVNSKMTRPLNLETACRVEGEKWPSTALHRGADQQ
jgi:glycosyltransferase involved in cell wall biosynthesis